MSEFSVKEELYILFLYIFLQFGVGSFLIWILYIVLGVG